MPYKKFLISILITSFSIITSDTTYPLIKKGTKKTIQIKKQFQKYGPLIDRLSNDGFDRTCLLKTFSDSRAIFQEKALLINIINSDINTGRANGTAVTNIKT